MKWIHYIQQKLKLENLITDEIVKLYVTCATKTFAWYVFDDMYLIQLWN